MRHHFAVRDYRVLRRFDVPYMLRISRANTPGYDCYGANWKSARNGNSGLISAIQEEPVRLCDEPHTRAQVS